MPYIIIREVETDKIVVKHVCDGFTCPTIDDSYRWAGFWETEKAARSALKAKGRADLWYDDERPTIYSQLYGDPRPLTGTPGPEAMKELLRF